MGPEGCRHLLTDQPPGQGGHARGRLRAAYEAYNQAKPAVERFIDAGLSMAIFKSEAQVLDETGRPVGRGTVYVHLPRGLEREQDGGGTVSLKSWTPSDRAPRSLRLADGRRLDLRVSRDALSDCSNNRVLRFEARWPPERAP